jgi:hypothetical protein
MRENKENEPKTANKENTSMSANEIMLIRDRFGNYRIRSEKLMVCVDSEEDKQRDLYEVFRAIRMHFGEFFENKNGWTIP